MHSFTDYQCRENQAASFEGLASRIELAEQNIVANIVKEKKWIVRGLDQTRRTTNQIIDSLRFPEIYHRRDLVPVAHQHTFDWIFLDTSSPFLTWLETGDGIFWITGKAGSGKSTLMKYLSSHDKTRDFIRARSNARSDSRHALLLDFYFWYSGTPMQKSAEGLLRSLLYHILRFSPDAVPIASPRRFKAAEEFHRDPDHWTYQELWESISRVAKEDLSVDYYIFVDGLDEYEGHHPDLIKLLQDLADNPHVCLCVSSRPWNVFDRTFRASSNWLRLEDLTRYDIETYVADKLCCLPQVSDVMDLVQEVVDKAQGVFLWVFLVVRELCKGYLEGDSITILHARLRMIPSDLNKYFDEILSRVDGVYSSHTAQVLRIAVWLTDHGAESVQLNSYLCFWLVAQGIGDPDFASTRPVQYCSYTQFQEFAHETNRFLFACCKDLLYFRPDLAPLGSDYDFQNLKVDFLHRTVYEFLKYNVMEKVESQLPKSFKLPTFLRHLTLAHLKLVPKTVDLLNNYHEVIQANLRDTRGGILEQQFLDVSLHYYLRQGSTSCRCYRHDFDCCRYVEYEICRRVDILAGTSSHPWPLLVPSLGLLPEHDFRTSRLDCPLIRVLLTQGALPNQYIDCLGGTIWHAFLKKVFNEVPSLNAVPEPAQIAIRYLMGHGADMTSPLDCSGVRSGPLLTSLESFEGEATGSEHSLPDLMQKVIPKQWLDDFNSHWRAGAPFCLARNM